MAAFFTYILNSQFKSQFLSHRVKFRTCSCTCFVLRLFAHTKYLCGEKSYTLKNATKKLNERRR